STAAIAKRAQRATLEAGGAILGKAGSQCPILTGHTCSWADRYAGKLLPFDQVRALRLYRALFAQAEDLIKGQQLLLVPSGSLTQLPFQVLVKAPASEGNNRAAACGWRSLPVTHRSAGPKRTRAPRRWSCADWLK